MLTRLQQVRMMNRLGKHYAFNAVMYGKESTLAKTAYNTYRLFAKKYNLPLYKNPFLLI